MQVAGCCAVLRTTWVTKSLEMEHIGHPDTHISRPATKHKEG
jgi:hypothetical protein